MPTMCAMTISLFAPRDGAQPIDPKIVTQAATWLAIMQSGIAGPTDQLACQRWRDAHPDHERAWQRMSALSQDVRKGTAGLTPTLARQALYSTTYARRTILKSVAGLTIAGAGFWGVRESTSWKTLTADYSTGTGEQRTITLADNTQVMLDTNSAIDVQFTNARRHISLRTGAIMVTTAKDPMQRPFVVMTDSGSITPIGTRFTVQYDPDHSPAMTQVAVMEGAVDIHTQQGNSVWRVHAGQQTQFSHQTIDAIAVLNPSANAWTKGMLVVERMRLADFTAKLNHYYKGSLRCAPAVADLLVSGAFSVDDPHRVLALLQETLPVHVRYITRYWATLDAQQE